MSNSLTPDLHKIEEAVLALLWLASYEEGHFQFAYTRSWKTHDWETLFRLHRLKYISNPDGDSHSITFTREGEKVARECHERLFCSAGSRAAIVTRQPFTPSALPLWSRMSEAEQADLVNHVFCSHCPGSTRMADFTGCKESDSLVLRGFCEICGHVVVRYIETGKEGSND